MRQLAIGDEEKQFFLENGYLIARGALEAEELRRVRAAMDELTEYGRAAVRDDPDYMYGIGHRSGRPVLRRIEYVVDKRDECKVLLANPFILRSTETLMGKDLIPTWDTMVLKMPGEGIVVPWHRDAATGSVGDRPIFNVDFYLDEADEDTCVWVIPGSHLWSEERVREWLAAQPKEPASRAEFAPPEAVPALMQPGDVLFHNILVLHGSPANASEKLRRVVYYEFRPAHVEEALGPHVPAYIPVKQKELLACIARRKAADYIPKDEVPYAYDPPAPYDTVSLLPGEELATYRYPHEDYWRPGAWTPKLSLDVKGINQARPSPDGKRVVYTVTSAVMTDEKSEYVTQIHLADADGNNSFQATFGEKSSRDPQWSPDGRWIAFTSNRAEKASLYRMRSDGGEAEKLTDTKADVGGFAWSPDGRWIAFVMPEAKDEAEEKRDKGRDDWRWVNEDHKRNRLYLLPVEKDLAGKRDPRPLTPTTLHIAGPFDWSPDGKEIAFSHQKTPSADDWPTADVSIVHVTTGEIRPLAATPAAEMHPLYSPDGKWIALSISDDPPRWAFFCAIHVVPAEGGMPRPLGPTHDGQPGLVGWSADGQRIYFSEAYGTRTRLCAMDVETGAITELNSGEGLEWEFALNSSRNAFGFTRQSTETAVEACVTLAGRFAPTQVSRENADLPQLPLGATEVLRWPSAGGLEIEGLLTYPVGYAPGQRVPLLLIVHGGPAGVFMQNFIAAPMLYPVATFAARGYAVLRCNPRGSSGYGKEFRFANQKDWGGGDYQDLMRGVDKVVEMGVADPDHLGVMGWSYGGYMTSWIITQTRRFKAASVGAGVTNLMSFTGTADIPGFLPDYFGAQPWDNPDTYRDHSAMFNVKGVTTPTLIQHPEADVRVPISQGYELYNALRMQGVETRMLVLPRQPHGLSEPKMQLKVMETNLEWFAKYLTP